MGSLGSGLEILTLCSSSAAYSSMRSKLERTLNGGGRMQVVQKLFMVAACLLLPTAAHATKCDQFKAVMIEDAAAHQQPSPKFQPTHIQMPADADSQSIEI